MEEEEVAAAQEWQGAGEGEGGKELAAMEEEGVATSQELAGCGGGGGGVWVWGVSVSEGGLEGTGRVFGGD